MNIKQIFQNARVLVNDKKYNSNLSSEDTFVKDVQLWHFLNDAITEFDFNTGIERFAYEDGNFQINILSGIDLYNLPENIAKIDTVELTNGTNTLVLEEVAYENLLKNTFVSPSDSYLAVNLEGNPVAYSLDYMSQKIKLYPIPNDNWTLKMRGTYYQTVFSQSDLNKEVPFPAKFHQAFVYYLAYRMTEIIDFDTFDLKISRQFYGQFREWARMAKIEQAKLERQNTIWTNGAYNA